MSRFRILAVVLALCVAGAAEIGMTVEQLFAFIQSSVQIIKEGKMTDKALADYLAKSKLTERLDDRSVEQMQSLGIGPKTLEALHRLRDQSQSLAAAPPIEPPAPPRQAPPPSSEEQAAIIHDVREYALAYSQSLPDFICTQVTRRYGAPRPGTQYGGRADSEPAWQALDTLTVRLSYFGQKEDYKLILVNGSLTTQDYKTLDGATTTGDFGSMMKGIFEPATEARFEWDHWATLRSRLTMAFAYRVEQARSQWHIVYDRSLDIVPAYHGLVYVDPKTHEVMRVTLAAEDLPPDYPVKMAETILDYDYQDLSGHTFLLPLKARTTMTDSNSVRRNDEEFRLYRKYTAESDIRFDLGTPDPLPDDQTKETAPSPANQPPPKRK
ncbi:MAG: hypothetical protein ABSC23_13365 [Bryobacteraceae bacterium]|jgi:hypothetical protein